MNKLADNLKQLLAGGDLSKKHAIVVTGKNIDCQKFGLTQINGFNGIYTGHVSPNTIKQLAQDINVVSIDLDDEKKIL